MKPTICLNMIVKNEAPVILRCLKSIKPWVDTWVISDTGSTDGTQDLIREFMKDMPGQLIERPWVDFAHNRNEALEVARTMADYSLFIDADQQFIPLEGFQGINVDQKLYGISVQEPSRFGSCSSAYFLLRNRDKMEWKGVLHEYLYSDEGLDGCLFSGGHLLSLTEDGARSRDPNKYLKDAWVLEEGLKKEPENGRYMFYLGQSYNNAREYALALKAFEKRGNMKWGDNGETFFALFMVGLLQETLGIDPDIRFESYKRAHLFCTTRQEPIYKMAEILVQKREIQEAYDLLKPYVFVYDLTDQYCLQTDIRDYLLPILFARCCYELKKYEECYATTKKVVSLPRLPEDLCAKLKVDLSFMKSNIPYLV